MGMLMNLNAFSLRDIQTAVALITAAESDGVMDILFVRKRLQEHILTKHAEMKKTKIHARIYPRVTDNDNDLQPKKCPSCKRGFLVKVTREDIFYYACSQCRYSKII